MKLGYLLFYLAASFAQITRGTELPPKVEKSRIAYTQFKTALIDHFQLEDQELSLPSTKIASPGCEILIKDVSEYGDRIWLEINRENQHWFVSVQSGDPAQFSKWASGFIFKTLAQDCEEQGCDGNWYASRTVLVSDNLLRFSSTEPYSHQTSAISCTLK